MNKLNIIGLLLLILISSCRKDINDVIENTTNDEPIVLVYTPNVNNITGSLIGQVVDENNQPMSSVKIKMNGENYFTNEFGHFIINDVTMNSLGQLVSAKQDATHFSGSRRFFPQAGATSRVKIQLIKKEFTYEFSAQESAEVLIEGGAKVQFEPNSIKDTDGNIYQGTVMVASHWLDPLDLKTLDKMPGNLQGVNTLSEEVALQTFGMIAVELKSPNGIKLNIADGKTATITMPLSDILTASAPEQIPLWSYNEEYGLWQEESSATLQNNSYVGEVSHFSFWNCDDPHTLVELMITYTDASGNPLTGHLVKVELGNGVTGTGYTDMDGKVVGLFPANEILTFSILNECGSTIASQNFGPFNTNTDLGTVALLVPNANNTIIKGILLDCDNNLISNGLVIVKMNGYSSYHYVGSGEFEVFVSTCNNISAMSMYGVNMDNLEQSTTLTVIPDQVNDLGDIQVCGIGGLQNYIRVVYNVDTIFLFTDATGNIDTDWTFINSEGNNTQASINFNGITTGDYSDNNYVEAIYDQNVGYSLSSLDPNLPTFTSFNVTQYDTKLVGTFSGIMLGTNPQGQAQVQVQGDFNINL